MSLITSDTHLVHIKEGTAMMTAAPAVTSQGSESWRRRLNRREAGARVLKAERQSVPASPLI